MIAAKSRAEKGLGTPSIDNAPELDDDLLDVWSAFTELSQSRTYGFGPNPIQISEIEAWLRFSEISSWDEKQWYLKLVKQMDCFWLKETAAKNKDENNGNSGSSN